jgi:hypothetical protein
VFIGDSSKALCTCDDGQLRKVDFEAMDIETTIRVSEVCLTCIEHLGGNYYAMASVEGSIYTFNLAYNVVSQTLEAHPDSVTKLVALCDKVRCFEQATAVFTL